MYERLFELQEQATQQNLMQRLPSVKSVLLEIQIRNNPEQLIEIAKDKNQAYIQKLKQCLVSEDIIQYIDQKIVKKNNNYCMAYEQNVNDPYFVAIRLFKEAGNEITYNFDDIFLKYQKEGQKQDSCNAANKIETTYEALMQIIETQTGLHNKFDYSDLILVTQLFPNQYTIAKYMYGKYKQLNLSDTQLSSDQILTAFCQLTKNAQYIHIILQQLQQKHLFSKLTEQVIVYQLLHNSGFRSIFNTKYFINYNFMQDIKQQILQSKFLLNNQFIYQSIQLRNLFNESSLKETNAIIWQQLDELIYYIDKDDFIYSYSYNSLHILIFMNTLVIIKQILLNDQIQHQKQQQYTNNQNYQLNKIKYALQKCFQVVSSDSRQSDNALNYLDPELFIDFLHHQYPLIQLNQAIIFRCLAEGPNFSQKVIQTCKERVQEFTKDFIYFICQSFRQILLVYDQLNIQEDHQYRQKIHDHLKFLYNQIGGFWDESDETYGYSLHTYVNYNEIVQRQTSLNSLLLQYNLEISDIYNICMSQCSSQTPINDQFKYIYVLLQTSANYLKNQKNIKTFTRYIQLFDYFIDKYELLKSFHVQYEIQIDYLITCQLIQAYIINFQLIEQERVNVANINQQIQNLFQAKKTLEKQTLDQLVNIVDSSRVFNIGNVQQAQSSNIIDTSIHTQQEYVSLYQNNYKEVNELSLDSLKKQIVKEIQKSTNYQQQQLIEEFASECDNIRYKIMKNEQELKYLQEKLNKLYRQQNDSLDQQIQLVQNKIYTAEAQLQQLYQQDAQLQQQLCAHIHQDYVTALYQIIKHDQTDDILQNKILSYREVSFQSSQNIYVNEQYIKRFLQNLDLQKMGYIYNSLNQFYLQSLQHDIEQNIQITIQKQSIFDGFCQYNIPPQHIKESIYQKLKNKSLIQEREYKWVKWLIYNIFNEKLLQYDQEYFNTDVQGKDILQQNYFMEQLSLIKNILVNISIKNEQYFRNQIMKCWAPTNTEMIQYMKGEETFETVAQRWISHYLLSAYVIPFYKLSFPRFAIIRSYMTPQILDTIHRDFYNDIINNRIDSIIYTLTEELQKIKSHKNNTTIQTIQQNSQINDYSSFIQEYDVRLLNIMAYLFVERTHGIFHTELNITALQENAFCAWHGYIYVNFIQQMTFLFTKIRDLGGQRIVRCGIFQNLLSQMLESNNILINQRILLQKVYNSEENNLANNKSKQYGKQYFFDLLNNQSNLLFINFKQLHQIISYTQIFELEILKESHYFTINQNINQQQDKKTQKSAFHFTDTPYLEQLQLNDENLSSKQESMNDNQLLDMEMIKQQFSVVQQQLVILQELVANENCIDKIIIPQQVSIFSQDFVCKPTRQFIQSFIHYYFMIDKYEVNNMIQSYKQSIKSTLDMLLCSKTSLFDQNVQLQVRTLIDSTTVKDANADVLNTYELYEDMQADATQINLQNVQMKLLQKPISFLKADTQSNQRCFLFLNNVILCQEVLSRLKYILGYLKLHFPDSFSQVDVDGLYDVVIQLYS